MIIMDQLWDIFVGIILGTVEALTEFMPVSSTGHMIIVAEKILNFTGERAKIFQVIVQFGSILAVVVIFWNRLISMCNFKWSKTQANNKLSFVHIFLGILPACTFGVIADNFITKHLFGTLTVAIGLILGGFLMIAAQISKTTVKAKTLDEISYSQALWVGLFQCFSLWPGFSRSGSTISGGVLSGLHYRVASEFSFLLAVPIMCGATLLKLYKNWHLLSVNDLPLFISGLTVAFLVALLAIKFFLRLISRVKLIPFAIYRFILAAVLLIVIFA